MEVEIVFQIYGCFRMQGRLQVQSATVEAGDIHSMSLVALLQNDALRQDSTSSLAWSYRQEALHYACSSSSS